MSIDEQQWLLIIHAGSGRTGLPGDIRDALAVSGMISLAGGAVAITIAGTTEAQRISQIDFEIQRAVAIEHTSESSTKARQGVLARFRALYLAHKNRTRELSARAAGRKP